MATRGSESGTPRRTTWDGAPLVSRAGPAHATTAATSRVIVAVSAISVRVTVRSTFGSFVRHPRGGAAILPRSGLLSNAKLWNSCANGRGRAPASRAHRSRTGPRPARDRRCRFRLSLVQLLAHRHVPADPTLERVAPRGVQRLERKVELVLDHEPVVADLADDRERHAALDEESGQRVRIGLSARQHDAALRLGEQ